ncbi:MAG: LPS assembly lipoprotein LptE [Rhodocyclaceae bacterium]
MSGNPRGAASGSGRRAALSAALALALSACGFRLRGAPPLAIGSLHVSGASPDLGLALRRAIEAEGNTRITATAKEARAQLRIRAEEREKSVLTLNAAGQVREYLLAYRVLFDVLDASGKPVVAPGRIELTREIPFSSSQLLAREAEEALLYQDMQRDAVRQMLRRLASARF